MDGDAWIGAQSSDYETQALAQTGLPANGAGAPSARGQLARFGKRHVDAPAPGCFWKTPFLWEQGCPLPPEISAFSFQPVEQAWLESALAVVMSHSLDESDAFDVAKHGPSRAALNLLELCPQLFDRPSGWWQVALDSSGRQLGFVLPVLFKDAARFKDGRPQGTILYMGMLPEQRGKGVGYALLQQATRNFIAGDCWRIFCDTSSRNEPMLRSFRKAGYMERKQWQRPFEFNAA